jgi:tRNA threonylcarbamoyladenosine biosynthesis protein TsaB
MILALDTSSSLGSVALSRGDELLDALAFEADHGHSQTLLPSIDALMRKAGVGPREIELFAVVVGPGSFTGLRVALASLRGLAGSRPCFGALATDVAARAGRGRGARVLALTDLFHGEVFGSVHDDRGSLISTRESGELGAVLERLRGSLEGPAVAVGSAAAKHRASIEAILPGTTFLPVNEGLAPHLARLAADQASPATTCPASDLLPFYLRDPLTRGLLDTPPKAR